MTTTDPTTPSRWAVLELFGHGRLAGAVSEEQLGSETFIRIDVPEVSFVEDVYVDGVRTPQRRVIQAHTKLLGGKAVYGIAYVDEAAALLAAHRIKYAPIKEWELSEALHALPLSDRRMLLQHTAGGDDDQG